MNNHTAHITEIFSSIQGEGPYVGYRQIFLRFSGCNLQCRYCDTDHRAVKPLSVEELIAEIKNLNKIPHHSISLTGGEPLLQVDFLGEFLSQLKKVKDFYTQSNLNKENFSNNIKIYLETNATLPDELEKIIQYIDIISMDIKIESSTGKPMPYAEHAEFIRIACNYNKEIFAKVVVGENITQNEIGQVKKLVKDDIPLILQPVHNACSAGKLLEIQDKFFEDIKDVRIIPQMHKYMGLR